jgi:DNA-binding helix-hairpin-helix protein with protein kinase domain
MPVTARLSRKFYDTFGDELTNELVEWLNSVDVAYRLDLKEFNELNFARFDAKLEQKLTEFDAHVERRLAEFERTVERRLSGFENTMDHRLMELDQKIEQRTLSLRVELSREIARAKVQMMAMMFLFFIGTVATGFLTRAP